MVAAVVGPVFRRRCLGGYGEIPYDSGRVPGAGGGGKTFYYNNIRRFDGVVPWLMKPYR